MKRENEIVIAIVICALAAPAGVGAVMIESARESGTVRSYLQAWEECRSKADNLKRGEYESKKEYKERKERAYAKCDGFEDVAVRTNWSLSYNADRQRFIIKLSEAFPGLKIRGLVGAHGGNKMPSSNWNDIPERCKNRWSTTDHYTCRVTRTADCEKPDFAVDGIVRRVDIDAHCSNVYTRQANSGWTSRYKISYDTMALYIPLEEARGLKEQEDALYIRAAGELARSGKLKVSSFEIVNEAEKRTIISWQRN